MGDDTTVNGETLDKPPTRAARLKSWATLLGAIAAVIIAATSMFGSLGVDKLVARLGGQQTAQAKQDYDQMATANANLRAALRIAFERIGNMEDDIGEIKQDYRMSMWSRMTTGRRASAEPAIPPPPPVAAPTTSDVESLLDAAPPTKVKSKSTPGILDILGLGKKHDRGMDLLDEAKPPKWEQVQEQYQDE